MDDPGVLEAVQRLLASDPDVASADELAAITRDSAVLRNFSSYVDVRAARRSKVLAAEGSSPPAGGVLIDEGRLTGNDAKAAGERDRVCTEMPAFEDALASGSCTAGHVDALAGLTKGLTDEERSDLASVVDDLVADAESQPISLFEKTARATIDKIRELHRPGSDADELDRQRQASKVKRWTDRDTGMKHTLIALDPLRDASLHAAVNAHLERLRHEPSNKGRPFDELRVEAVLSAVSAGANDGL